MRYFAALAAIMVLAVPAAGCGEKEHKQTESERIAMENEFSKLAIDIANTTITSGPATRALMERYTRRYVSLTRKYEDDLGDNGVRERLSAEVRQVQPWCLTCAKILVEERARY